MESNKCLTCVDCGVKKCITGKNKYPNFCVSKTLSKEEIQESKDFYLNDEQNLKVATASAEIEADFYCRACRVEETIRWAKKLGAKKIGIATCVGLIAESKVLAGLLREYGFEVYGVGCKAGEVGKEEIGIDKRCNATGKNMCNPIMQAKLLNKEKTDINIVMGLCVGHDSLFYKYSEAITTTLVVKDRVLGNNPVAALNNINSYYGHLHNLKFDEDLENPEENKNI